MREGNIREKKKERERKRYMCTYFGWYTDAPSSIFRDATTSPSTYNKSIKISTITWVYLYFTTIYFNLANALKQKNE